MRIHVAILPFAALLLASLLPLGPAIAQFDGSAPCAGSALSCVDATAPNEMLAKNGVVRLDVDGRYTDNDEAWGWCGSGFYVEDTYEFDGQVWATLVTNRHIVEGVAANGRPYVATAINAEFFYVPVAGRACGVLGQNECYQLPGDCATPTIIGVPCWDWDYECDLARLYILVGNIPANAASIPLGADPLVDDRPWIPQHPQARCMEWSEGPVTAYVDACDFEHEASTQHGSSGSPVIHNDQVVGVHRAASPGDVCPNKAVFVSQLLRYLGLAPTPICSATPTQTTSWGKIKMFYR